MRRRGGDILLGILCGGIGAWLAMTGLGNIISHTAGPDGARQLIAGLVFFFAGAWLFFQSTLGPGGEVLPVYGWIEYFMILPILAGLGLFFILEGRGSGEFKLVLIGLLPLVGALWYAIARFPARGGKP
jgi:hypothetical protein